VFSGLTFLYIKFLVYFLRQGGDHDFQVIHLSNSGDKYAVNLQGMVCDCRKWNLTGLLCCHAIACMKHKHYNIADYVPSIYKKEAYAECYSSKIYPANGENLWMRTEYTDLQPPAIKKQPRRPKKKRRLDASELLREEGQMKRASYGIKCSRCKQSGHNKSTCPLPPPPPPPPESETQASQVPPSQPQAQVETQTNQAQVSQTQASQPQATQSQTTQAQATQSQASQPQTTQKQNASTRKRKAKEPSASTKTTQSQTSQIPPTQKPNASTKKRKASHQVSATQPKQAAKPGNKGRKKGGSATQPM
jgi:hypothetical protein